VDDQKLVLSQPFLVKLDARYVSRAQVRLLFATIIGSRPPGRAVTAITIPGDVLKQTVNRGFIRSAPAQDGQ
jgi:hypothetical protein